MNLRSNCLDITVPRACRVYNERDIDILSIAFGALDGWDPDFCLYEFCYLFVSDEIGVVEFIWVPACLGVRVSILVFLPLCLKKLINPAVRIDDRE